MAGAMIYQTSSDQEDDGGMKVMAAAGQRSSLARTGSWFVSRVGSWAGMVFMQLLSRRYSVRKINIRQKAYYSID